MIYRSQNSSQLSRRLSHASVAPSLNRLTEREPNSLTPCNADRPRVTVFVDASDSIFPMFSTSGRGLSCSPIGRTVSRSDSLNDERRPPKLENMSLNPSDCRRSRRGRTVGIKKRSPSSSFCWPSLRASLDNLWRSAASARQKGERRRVEEGERGEWLVTYRHR